MLANWRNRPLCQNLDLLEYGGQVGRCTEALIRHCVKPLRFKGILKSSGISSLVFLREGASAFVAGDVPSATEFDSSATGDADPARINTLIPYPVVQFRCLTSHDASPPPPPVPAGCNPTTIWKDLLGRKQTPETQLVLSYSVTAFPFSLQPDPIDETITINEGSLRASNMLRRWLWWCLERFGCVSVCCLIRYKSVGFVVLGYTVE